jgi:hypothetical protein
MKKISIIIILLIVSQLSIAQSKDEIAVSSAIQSLKKALLDPNRTSLEALTAEALTYGHSSGLVENRQQFIEALVSGDADYKSIELSNQNISFSKDIALVRHRMDTKISAKGAENILKLDVLLVWQKQRGKWILLARQAVRVTS